MQKDRSLIDAKYIDVLDGIRAISVIIVLIFHFWQQTWIFPTFETPWLSWIGVDKIDFTALARVGYLFVDMMVLISGFLLFMPVARSIIYGDPMQKWGDFYKKRAIRILPSYLLCILVCFILETTTGGYKNAAGALDWGYAIRDLLSHLTFMQTLRVDTYISTKLNVVLWTLAIEVWFYILFPLIAKLTGRWSAKDAVSGIRIKGSLESSPVNATLRTVGLAIGMIGLSHLYIYEYALASGSDFSNAIDKFLSQTLDLGIRSSYLSMVINQFPAFLGVYANGILGALAYTVIAKNVKRSRWLSICATAASLSFAYLIAYLVNQCAALSSEAAQVWQMTERLKLTFIFTGFIISTALAAKWYRWLFSNAFMRYLSAISFNLYIWHQWLAVKLKYEWRIPFWEGDMPPNQLWNKEWQWDYAIIITVFAFAAATIVTYLFERPVADLLNRRPSIYNGKLKLIYERWLVKKKSK